MNFDVTKVMDEMDESMNQVNDVTKELDDAIQEKTQPKKMSPVELLQRKNDEYRGAVVEHKEVSHALKSSVDSDLEDVMQEMPNNITEIQSLGDRIARTKIKLGLGEGGFVDQEIDIFNQKTRTFEGKQWLNSSEINAMFIAMEPIMTDEQLEQFFRDYYVEFDLQTGEVKPLKYPRREGYKCSVTFPAMTTNTVVPVVTNDTPVNEPVVPTETEDHGMSPTETEAPEKNESNTPIVAKKIKFKVEEKSVGVRKKIPKEKKAKISEMIMNRNMVPVTAPASRYKCDITSVTYDEYAQIRTMIETSSLAKETKMWSMIYRHVKNPTIGEFKSFEDFCEHTAYADRSRFWFGMMCSMTKDTDTVQITCNNRVFKRLEEYRDLNLSDYKEAYSDVTEISLLPTNKVELEDLNIYTIMEVNGVKFKYIPMIPDENTGIVRWTAVEQEGSCKTTYDHEYANIGLIDAEDVPEWIKDEIVHINDIQTLDEAIAYHEEGALIRKRIISLNDIVSIETGFKSVADVLRKDYKYIVTDDLSETMKSMCVDKLKEMKEDPDFTPTDEEISNYLGSEDSESLLYSILACQVIDKVIINDGDEEYESDDPDDIVTCVMNCSPSEIAIIANDFDTNTLVHRYNSSYSPSFSYKDCTCPACGNKTRVPIEKIDDLVFALSRSLMNTTFDITTL